MQKKYHYTSLNILEASVLSGLELGFTIDRISWELDISCRSVEFTIKKLLKRYNCTSIDSLLTAIDDSHPHWPKIVNT